MMSYFMVDLLDKMDIAISECLQRDGRLSNVKLAEQLSLSEASCWRRQRRLEECGVIEGYQAILNRKKLGLALKVFVQISCTDHSPEATSRFEKIVHSAPQVLSCHNTTGEADFLLVVVCRDLDNYSRFVENVLRKLPGVSNIRSNLSLREIKTTNRLPVAELLSM